MPFIDPRKTPFVSLKTRGELPHLYKPGGTYFVTYRLWDAVIPRAAGAAIEITDQIEPEALLDGYDPPLTLGGCALRDDRVAKLVQDAFLHFEGQRYALRAWVVMPNHVHVIFQPWKDWTATKILRSWKGFTGKHANEVLRKDGQFWERENFDHLVRSETSLMKFVRYVEMNPVVAGLVGRKEDWPWGSAGCRFVPRAYWDVDRYEGR
jgi:REP element-mobilizing transposase RayT